MDDKRTQHWTETSDADFQFRIASDFVTQIQAKMQSEQKSQAQFARELGVTEGRISQIINNPGNLTLSSIVRWARTLGLKVSVLAYDDDDPENLLGPIHSDVFRICWERLKKPRDNWDLGCVACDAVLFPPTTATTQNLPSMRIEGAAAVRSGYPPWTRGSGDPVEPVELSA